MGNSVLERLDQREDGAVALRFLKSAYPLHALTVAAGVESPRAGAYDCRGLERGPVEWAAWQYTLSGCGELEFEGRRYTVRPGQAFALYFPHDNRYWLPAGGEWRIFYVSVCGAEALRAWRYAVDKLGPVIDAPEDSPLLECAARACLATLDGELTDPWRSSVMAYELAMRLLSRAIPHESTREQHDRPLAVKQALDYVRCNYADDVTAEDIAAASGLSRFHFARVFRESEGIAPTQHLMRVRVREALRLLQTTDLPIKTVARRCGYIDPNYFCKVFRKAVGMSPGCVRRSGMYPAEATQA